MSLPAAPDSGPDIAPELKPIYNLINTGNPLLPELHKKNVVQNGIIEAETEKGRMSVSVVALPPEDARSGLQKFWDKVRRKVTTEDSLPPTPLVIQPRLYADEFRPGEHVQLMGHMPHAVLENNTRYGISVKIPAWLTDGEWEEFSGPVDTWMFNLWTQATEVGRRRKSFAVVVRTDDGQPLLRQKIESSRIPVFQEMLAGFKPEDGKGNWRAFIDRRRTVTKSKPSSELGETQQNSAVEESLIFTSLGENVWVGTTSDHKWKVQVVVYEVTEKEIKEIVETPRDFGFMSSGNDIGTLLWGGALKMGGWFSAGRTSYGKETKRKVNSTGVRIEKPIAAFELVLVGEMPGKEMEMIETTSEA